METRTTIHFIAGNNEPGAVTFRGTLTLGGGQVTGMGSITQAVSPPFDRDLVLSGSATTLVFNGAVTQSIHLTGRGFIPRLPMPRYMVDLTCAMLIDNTTPGAGVGHASLSYVDAQGEWQAPQTVPVKMSSQRAPD